MDIYIPTIKEGMLQSAHNTVKGYIKWEVINNNGSIAQRGEHPNLILNAGLDTIAVRGFADTFVYNCVGTGNSTPIVTQVALDVERARTNSYIVSPSGSCGTTLSGNNVIMTRTFNWLAGTLDSSVQGPYAEVGFSWASTAGSNLWSRSLFKDANGNPTTVNVASDQQLRVVYILTVTVGSLDWVDNVVTITGLGTVNYKSRCQQGAEYGTATDSTCLAGLQSVLATTGASTLTDSGNYPNLEPFQSTSKFNSTTYKWYAYYVLALANASYLTAQSLPVGQLPDAFSNAAGANLNNSSVAYTSSTYVAGDFYRIRTLVADVNTGNGSNQWIFAPGNGGGQQAQYYLALRRPMSYFFPTPIVKDNNHTLTLNFKHSWGRAV